MTFGSALAGSISCLAWNADQSSLAFSAHDSKLQIILCEDPWRIAYTFEQHDLLISGVDWCHKHNRIVTCSHDRNAYVLAFKDGGWTPDMVVTRLKRPAVCIQWSPCGNKFAIGSAGKEISVCYSDPQEDWWAASIIRRLGSATLGLAWHPSGELLAVASADSKCQIFNAQPSGQVDSAKAFKGCEFGHVLMEIQMDSWCLSVAWSPLGDKLACSTQGSEVAIWEGLKAISGKISFRTYCKQQIGQLPFTQLAFSSDTQLLAAGFDSEPFKLERAVDADGQWLFLGACKSLRQGKGVNGQPPSGTDLPSEFSDKMAIFKPSPLKTRTSEAANTLRHTKAVTSMTVFNKYTIATAALDGSVLLWRPCT